MFHFDFYFYTGLTDWIQAITGIVGMVALIWTLYLQRRATIIQAEAVKIEDERDRRALLPIFTLTHNESGTVLNDPNRKSFTLALERGDAFNFGLGPLQNSIADLSVFTVVGHWQAGDQRSITFWWLNEGGLPTDSRQGPLTVPIGKIYFYDEGRRAYSQMLHTNSRRIILSLAQEIENKEMTSVIYNFRDFR